MDRERRNHALDPGAQPVLAAEVVEDDDASAGAADAAHLARDGHRVRHDADHVRRIDDVEGVVGELEVRGIHLQQPDVAHAFARHALARLLEHGAREVDTGHRTVGRIQRGVDAGAHANLEHTIAGLDAHPLNGANTAGVERRTEDEVVNGSKVFVDAGDEGILDSSDRQGPRGDVGRTLGRIGRLK